MKSMFRNLVTLMLLLPFFAGTIGISASEHICKSSNKRSIKLYPEFTGKISSCCGSDEEPAVDSGKESQPQTIDSPYCCKTLQLFLKAGFQATPGNTPVLLINPVAYTPVSPNNNQHLDIVFTETVSFFSDTGPPPSGRQRVLSFHQPKIPDPASPLS
ncbi:MAG: hypothetical protein WCO02_14225 [Bacteroidota bacterium]